MTTTKSTLHSPPTNGLNIIPFALMAGGWLSPLIMFWLYVWGPLRPYDYPPGALLPDVWFIFPVVFSFALWWVLPVNYFRVFKFERTGRVYELLGCRKYPCEYLPQITAEIHACPY